MEITARNPLTPLGHRVAERLAERCDEWDLQHLYVSTMLRAQQTADAISCRFPDLCRTDMPEFEELSIRDLAGFPGDLPAWDFVKWEDAHYAHANEAMWRRVIAGWDRVVQEAQAKEQERVAIVAHGGSLNVLMRHFLGESAVRLRSTWFELDWASSSCLRIAQEDGRIPKWIRWVNDARHIDALRPLLTAGA